MWTKMPMLAWTQLANIGKQKVGNSPFERKILLSLSKKYAQNKKWLFLRPSRHLKTPKSKLTEKVCPPVSQQNFFYLIWNTAVDKMDVLAIAGYRLLTSKSALSKNFVEIIGAKFSTNHMLQKATKHFKPYKEHQKIGGSIFVYLRLPYSLIKERDSPFFHKKKQQWLKCFFWPKHTSRSKNRRKTGPSGTSSLETFRSFCCKP